MSLLTKLKVMLGLEEAWDFLCVSCDEFRMIAKSGVPAAVKRGEEHAACPECGDGMISPPHRVPSQPMRDLGFSETPTDGDNQSN